VDLRHAGFKLAPVDTNLFPAGFNNLNHDFLPLCVQAVQSTLVGGLSHCQTILLLPESHTRNHHYLQSLAVMRDVFTKAGLVVRLGNLDESVTETRILEVEAAPPLVIEPLQRHGDNLGVVGCTPCLVVLNNDLSSGVPEVLKGIRQPILPALGLGWSSRLKSTHFHHYDAVVQAFASELNLDPWLINPLFTSVADLDFMSQQGMQELAQQVDALLQTIRDKYREYGVLERPFVAVKADNGTYGMSVMMVHEGAQLLSLNRKQRTKMAVSKGRQSVTRVLIQEGVYSFETMPNGAVAEPVIYMIGSFVVGGFYRVHQGRGKADNLNAPGMHFEPLAFAEACNTPCDASRVLDPQNRFYVYGVVARLAALAAAREAASLGGV
jgi:glutamate--cysteine ligase